MNRGELRSPDRGFSLSPVKMRILPTVLMRKVLPAEIQVMFQIKMVRFFLMYDGILDNCIRMWMDQFLRHKTQVMAQAAQVQFEAEQERLAEALRMNERAANEARLQRAASFAQDCTCMIEMDGCLIAVMAASVEEGKAVVEDGNGRVHELKASRVFVYQEMCIGMTALGAFEENMLVRFMEQGAMSQAQQKSLRQKHVARDIATTAEDDFKPIPLDVKTEDAISTDVVGCVRHVTASRTVDYFVFRVSTSVHRHVSSACTKRLSTTWLAKVDEYVSWHVDNVRSTPIGVLDQGVE